MYNFQLADYMPEPMPATSDRIIAAHYYAAWKKGAAGIHEGFDDLHGYPERTPLMGYYDEEDPRACDWEIKWALEHGINCFIYCWYRYQHNMGKPVTREDLRCAHALHEALFNAKYGKMMKFAIMFENCPRWGTTDETDMLDHLMPFWMENYFKKENYLVIDNKPVLFIYHQPRLDAVFPNPEDQKRTFDKCREYAKKCGFDGMIFGMANEEITRDAFDNAMARGYDFRFGYDSGYFAPYDYPPEQDIIDAQCERLEKRLAIDPLRHLATPTPFRDASPRTTQRWLDLGYECFSKEHKWSLSPDHYRLLLRRMKEMTDALPEGAWGRRIFMIDNWNEWDEGHYVAPTHGTGFRYLQAIREELTDRNNLPDYRTPADMGLYNYNSSWEEPDFSK